MAHGITQYLLAVRIIYTRRGKYNNQKALSLPARAQSGDDPFGSLVALVLSVDGGTWQNRPLSLERLSLGVDFEATSHRTGQDPGDLP